MKTNSKGSSKKCSIPPLKVRQTILSQYRFGLLSSDEIFEKYGISLNLLRKWNRQYQIRFNHTYYPSMMKTKTVTPHAALKALQAELKDLQAAYETAKLKSDAYEMMIQIAEKEFQIPIRKKYGSKLFNK